MNVKICKCKLALAVLGLSLGVCVQVLLAGAQQDSVPSAAAGADSRIVRRSKQDPATRRALIAPVGDCVLKLSPTYTSCGVCFGSRFSHEGLSLRFRKQEADGKWLSVRDFPRFEETQDYRGSLLRLEEDTRYDCQIVVGDRILAEQEFKTWASNVPVARTVVLDETVDFPVLVTDRGCADGWVRYTCKQGFVLDNETLDRPCFIVQGAEYVIFEDMRILGSGARNVFALANSKEIRIRNCDISRWGRVGEPRYDHFGRLYEIGRPATGYGINFDGAIDIGKGCCCITVERCFVHDPRGRANSWFYSHPAGPEAVTLNSPDHSTVIRWNDFVGSDVHRFNDAVESAGNFREDGGFNRDADVYGNFIIFCNDDCVELDGGQQNVRCFDNRFEASFCGVSIQGCMASPSYVDHNGFFSMGDEFGLFGQTIKTGGGAHGEEARAYVSRNLLWGDGEGIRWRELLKITQEDNVFCMSQGVVDATCSTGSISRGDRFGEVLSETDLPADLPARPLEFGLNRARFSGIRVSKGVVSPSTLEVVATGGVSASEFRIAKCEAFDWFDVTPSAGVIPANGCVRIRVSFDASRMTSRRNYRGAFLVRTPSGLSRPVSIYAETDVEPDYSPASSNDVAIYTAGLTCGTYVRPDEDKPLAYGFVAPSDGRYYFMIHGRHKGSLRVSVDGEPPTVSRQQACGYPTWTMLVPGGRFGAMTRHFDLKAGHHTVRLWKCRGDFEFDGIVLTDNPLAFEPR